ncbi:MAG: cell division protein FtsA [Bacillota bacterium]|nr:cell division protein FtsA [Bacillota bacterium]
MILPENEPIFALDIGTRTIIGILAEACGGGLRVLHQAVVEHQDRAMYDGQIHDIPKVAQAVASVRERLEDASGLPLKKVAVAAAGRSLRTQFCRAEREIDPDAEIDQNVLRSLELLALHEAHARLEQESAERENLYCVGYSPVRHYLDGLRLANLLGHRGRHIVVEAIVTFLPASVVNGLLSVLHRVDLEPVNMTLEPIAALDVAIPPDVRLLNLALVDIGAGTSDIALTRDGSILAYGMVPVAGDEITEAVIQACLVDFTTAEKIKRSIFANEEITYHNILGITESVSREQLLDIIGPALDGLAREVAGAIRDLNGGDPPRSVILIGGGAQVPTLPDRIAQHLDLPASHVVVRGRDMLRGIQTLDHDPLAGPQGVTVLGIASLTARQTGHTFLTVRVNGLDYRIFDSKNVAVSYVLGLIEFDPRQLFGRNGRDLVFSLNGQEEIVRGGLCRPARILVNGERANLQTPLHDGDDLTVIAAENGADARARVADYLAGPGVACTLNGERVALDPVCTLNDHPVPPETEIHDGDVLRITYPSTLADLARLRRLDPAGCVFTVNGREVQVDYVIQPGDDIQYRPHTHVDDIPAAAGRAVRVTVNGEEIALTGVTDPIFIDIFNFLDIAPDQRRGHPTVLLNGETAQYTQPLKDGDDILIFWED